MAAKKRGLAKGFTCTSCGREHEYPAYVYAHWNVGLVHTCKCKARHCITRGIAAPLKNEVAGRVHILKGDIIHVPRSKRKQN